MKNSNFHVSAEAFYLKQLFWKRTHPFMFSVLTLLTAATLGVAEDYTITVNSLGVGNTWTSGAVTPLQITVTSNVNEATVAWVQWEVPDADGDTVLWGKLITLSPVGNTSTWLYAPIQPWSNPSMTWTVRLRKWEENKPIGELAITRFSANSIGAVQYKTTEGFIAVFGTRRLGLINYQPHQPIEVKQEASIIVSGLQNNDLPDAWPCFKSLDAIVWADTTPQFSYRQETALRRWIERGGHFIISLPTIGDPWSLGTENGPLAELLIDFQPTIEQIPLETLDQVLGRNRGWPPIDVTVRTFSTQNKRGRGDDMYPILQTQNGKTIGVQRSIGFGTVTVIGVDLSSGQLASLGLPETDVLWNRILGKRGDTPSQDTISKLDKDEQLSISIPTKTHLPIGKLVAQEIAMATTAGGRLGTVFLLIFLYWVCSGPICYFILKRKRKQRWSWVVFAGVASTFTLVTWGLASTSSSVKTPLKHVAIIDHIYGGSWQRIIGWYSLYLPTFGNATVELEGEENNLLLPWTSPQANLTSQFVDHREIIVNLEHVPNQFDQPSRATTSNFSYEWLGGIDNPFYDSLIRVALHNEPVWISTPGKNSIGEIRGAIVNHATTSLQDVTVIWVTGERYTLPTRGRYQDNSIAPWIQMNQSGQPLNLGYSWRIPVWKSGETLDFADFDATPISAFSNAMKNRYQQEDSERGLLNSGVILKKMWRKKLEMLSLYSHLEPPAYQKSATSKQSPSSHHASREGGHELDLAEWFGKPCIIVMGFIPNAPIPVPISVNGEQITQSNGETFVRWVYPLGELQ
jgi:hypothetical protein